MDSAREFGSLSHLVRRFFGALSPAGPSEDDEAWARSWLQTGEQALWEQMSGPDRRHGVDVARRAMDLLGLGRPGDDAHEPGNLVTSPPDGRRVPPEGVVGSGHGGSDRYRAVVAAALLHDVGKIESGFGTVARAGVTALAMLVGRARLVRASDSPTASSVGGPGTARQPMGRPGISSGGTGRREARYPWTGRQGIGRRVALYLSHDRVGGDLLRLAGSEPLTSAWAAEHHLHESRWTIDRKIGSALKVADGD